jgi:asparagine synthase (glutamine-hydrolysing)
MCGIAGIIRFDRQPVALETASTMLTDLAHRGRDHSEMVWGSGSASVSDRKLSRRAEVVLGHRRLSVIDLSESASQPMSTPDGLHWIVFNGEIYNYIELRTELRSLGHEFRTDSDTEVILMAYRQWGEACTRRLNGMFAYALWDEPRQRLVCSRDPLGIKPFYFYRTPGFLAFASESKALRSFHRNELNPDGIAAYLLSLYLPADWSIFKGVSKLLPAHTMVIEPSGEIATRRYWQLSRVGDLPDTPADRTRLEELLEAAVTRQLRSDVPVGALLSAGVDSGMVVALAARHHQGLHTYSIAFEGHPVNELPPAAAVAERHHTVHHTALISDQVALQYLESSISRLTEPIADPSIVPSYILSEMAASDGVKVLLSGTGGDEIFGGYQRYAGGASFQRTLLSHTHESLRAGIGALLPGTSKLGSRLKNPYFDMLFNTGGSFELCASLLPDADSMGAFLDRLGAAFPRAAAGPLPLLYKQMSFDLSVYLPEEILFLFDQMSMAHTVEGRVPLLDIEVVEHAFRFPATSHVSDGKTKILFRQLAEPRLGTEHVWRKKHGFSGPVPWWVNRNLPRFRETVRSIPEIPGLGSFPIERHLRLNKQGVMGDREADALFILYCLRRWYDHQTEAT